MADDQALLAAARAGDQRAFAALYRNHHRRAMHEARKVVANRSDAEDCVAAAYASTFQAIRKGGGPTEAFRPYLLTAVRNSALQLVRLKRYGSEVTTDELEPPAHVDLYEIGADPAVRNAFVGLPERWREVLWKTEIEGMAPRDLATELAMSANGVAALAKRARDGFRRAYLTEAIGPDPHPWAMERLDLYRDGALDPRTRDLVELHVENCARCQDALAPIPVTAASIGVLLLGAGVVAPAGIAGTSAGITGSLAARVRHLRQRGTTVPAKVATASAVAVAVVGTLLAVVISARSGDDRTTPPATAVVASAPGSADLGAAVTVTPTRPNPTVTPSATDVPTGTPATTTSSSTTTTGPPPTVADADPTTTRRRQTTTTRRRTTTSTAAPTTAPPPVPTETIAPTTEATTTIEAPTTEATTTTLAPTTTETATTARPPVYGGTLRLAINRPSYTATVEATAADGLPAGTTITLEFTSAAAWNVTIGGATNCVGMPAAMSGGADEPATATCSMPALAQGTTATVPFTTSGTAPVTVVVTAQRPGGSPATQCDPSSAC
ncbi:MAG: sigma-70 family RNA polymerase sigma factor [Ilumatobacteraceae bacterium]